MSVRLSSMYDDMMTGNKSYSYGPLGKLLSFSKNRMKPRRRRTRILYDPCLSPSSFPGGEGAATSRTTPYKLLVALTLHLARGQGEVGGYCVARPGF